MNDKLSGSDQLGITEFYKRTNRFSAREYEELLSLKFIAKDGNIKSECRKDHSSCPICSTNLSFSNLIFKKNGYSHWNCTKCESIYTNPTLNDDIIAKEVYGTTHYPFLEIVNSDSQKDFDKVRFSKALGILLSHEIRVSGKSVFDFGCGSGYFLSLCREFGFEKLMGNDLLQNAINSSFELYNLDQVLLKNGYDDLERIDENVTLIALWEFLDHINEPKKFLKELVNKIEKGTFIIISVRNSDSIAARILRADCNMFLGHAHFNFWSNKAINQLICDFDLELVDYYQYISERDAVCNFLNYKNPYTGTGSNLTWIPSSDEILDNRMGYKHVMILKK